MRYEVFDKFNGRVISRHNTGLNAMKAAIRHSENIARLYGKTAYIPKEIRKGGVAIGADEYCDLIDEVERIGFNVRSKGEV